MSKLGKFVEAVREFRQAADIHHELLEERHAAIEAGRAVGASPLETASLAAMEAALLAMQEARP